MSFRITMGMKMNTYRYNLMQSTNTLANAQTKVETHRQFNSYAEAPSAATNAWRIRRNLMDNDSYQTQNKDVTTRFQTGWLSMGTMKTDLEQYLSKTAVIRAASDTTGEAKEQLGKVLKNAADTVIQVMNGAKYGDDFVFAGTNGTDAPFSWEGDKLLYRGINLTPPSMLGGSQKWPPEWGELDRKTGIPVGLKTTLNDTWEPVLDADGNIESYTHKYHPQKEENGKPVFDENGNPVPDEKLEEENVSKENMEWNIYFKNMETLNKLSSETQYANLGMGMEEDKNGAMVDGTYFNNAIPGINMLGYGVDEDGDPKNLALIMKKFNDVLSTVDENGNVDDSVGGNMRVLDLVNKFDEACKFTLEGFSYIDTESGFLRANGDNLENQSDNLMNQIINLEQVDMADAITQFMWDYTCYNASLKIGTQLLSQSLLDYMR